MSEQDRSPGRRGIIRSDSLLSRRGFLAGTGLTAGAAVGGLMRVAGWDATTGRAMLRPPGALAERDFLAACIRCGQCVEACPIGTLRLAGGREGVAHGTPYFVPREIPCRLCRGHDTLKCIAACPTGALRAVGDIREIRIGTAVLNTATCIAWSGLTCQVCYDVCPLPDEAISLDSGERPVVNAEACIGCGICDHLCCMTPSAIPVLPTDSPSRSPGEGGRVT